MLLVQKACETFKIVNKELVYQPIKTSRKAMELRVNMDNFAKKLPRGCPLVDRNFTNGIGFGSACAITEDKDGVYKCEFAYHWTGKMHKYI